MALALSTVGGGGSSRALRNLPVVSREELVKLAWGSRSRLYRDKAQASLGEM